MEYTEISQALLEMQNYNLTNKDLEVLVYGFAAGIEFSRRLQKKADVSNVIYLDFLKQLQSYVYRGYINFKPFEASVGFTKYLSDNLINDDSFSKKYTNILSSKTFNVNILFNEYLLDCIELIEQGRENDFYLRNLEVMLINYGKANKNIAQNDRSKMATALKGINKYAII